MGYIVSKKTLKEVISDLKRSNEKVILTHGAFDILHIGQLEFLKKSKAKGRVLILGIESDNRICYYKNIQRPIIPLAQRLKIMSSIDCVDFIFPIVDEVFHDEYYSNLYDELKPDILTYGRNFGGEKQIEKKKVYFKNIKFKKITHQYDKLQSTSKIIDKILTLNSQPPLLL